MTLRQLEIFLAVASAKNFTRAAETLHVSQPTLSPGGTGPEGAAGWVVLRR